MHSNEARAAKATQNNVQCEAGGSGAPLSCTAYFGKLACHSKRRPSLFEPT